MNTIEKSKNKGRPYPLRRVLLVMVAGLIFFVWMPVVIVSPTGIHPLTWVLYWFGAFAWLLPLIQWLRLRRQRSSLHQIASVVPVFGLWAGLFVGGLIITNTFSLPVFTLLGHRCNVVTGTAGQTRYTCYAPDLSVDADGRLKGCDFDCGFINSYFAVRIDAEGNASLPIARVTDSRLEFLTRSELADLYQSDRDLQAECC